MSVLNCQHCKTIIKAHESLLDLNSSTYDLIASIIPADKSEKIRTLKELAEKKENEALSNIGVSKATPKSLPELNNESNVAESYIMLGNSQLNPTAFNPNFNPSTPPSTPNSDLVLPLRGRNQPNNLAPSIFIPNEDLSQTLLCRQTGMYHPLNVESQLLEQLNDSSAFQHPLCNSCCQLLFKALNDKLNGLESERNILKKFNDQILSSKDLVDVKSLNKEVEELKEQEKASVATLYQFEKDLEALKLEIKQLEEESADLDRQEAEYYDKLNSQSLTVTRKYKEQSSADAKYEVDHKQLGFLHSTVVLVDLFPISQVDIIGTISGLRLGRSDPNHPTTWPEINAAWGQAVLALHTIATLAQFQFKGYKLVPYGSFSSIEKQISPNESPTSLELYLPAEPNILRMFLVTKYENAMYAYLQCITQLAHHFKVSDPAFNLPYKIDNDKINKLPLKYQFKDCVTWTRALRYTLRCLKDLISFSTRSKK